MFNDTSHHEKQFQNRIITELEKQGWLTGQSADYHKEYGVYPADVIGFIEDTQADSFAKLQRTYKGQAEQKILSELGKALDKHGCLKVLRDGFAIAGAGVLELTAKMPEDERNQTVKEKYAKNRLRVVPELVYNFEEKNRIDLVFFINGLAVATVELKSEFNQTLEDAKNQYKTDRLPFDKTAKRAEPLLSPKRGAIVHFAMTESEIAMTTELKGADTYFLPFNQGNNGHAGNAPRNDNYPTAYFWEQICQKDNWLAIFHRFVFVERKTEGNLLGQFVTKERLIFPRYHQFDAVTKMLADAKQNGAGMNYLCEHSAGSGKTSTIAWTAHGLTRLRYDDGEPYFHGVIIVTDRTVLDAQLQEAVSQIEHQKGFIATINRDDKEQSGKSKSKQLEEALLSNKPIIVVTIQTFPFVMEAILTTKSLSHQRYAIIIDEAHNSQTGTTASKLQATLAMQSSDEMADLTVEELLEKIQKSRVGSPNISHFAFTATPKHSTFMLFGREVEGETTPQSFHKYTMRQAIEEGFILDVLKGYISYETAYKLGGNLNDSKRVDVKEARRTLAKWQNLHATNVTQKVQFILAHFHHNVAHLLNGQAKAMVVTSSRPAAVRYKLAFEKYLQEQQYQDYRVLVAFSGSLKGSEIKHADDGEFDDVFNVADDDEFTENNLNPKGDLRKVFDGEEYRLMVVANKFQTGFDQPKLCAMYLDKKIANEVEVVQTLSRLNRTTKGKDTTFVVDFVNDPAWIQACFAKYDSGAEITEVQDPQVIYDIKDNLDKEQIYDETDLDNFKQAKFDTVKILTNNRNDEKQHQALFLATTPATKRFNDKLHQLQNELSKWESAFESAKQKGDENSKNQAEEHRKQTDIALKSLLQFKSNLAKFVRIYHYIAQLLDLGDPELENFSAFCKLLAKRLDGIGKDEIDVSGLILTGYAIRQNETIENPDESETLRPITGGGDNPQSPNKKDYLSEIIKMLSSAFGDVTDTDDQKQFINHLMAILAKDEVLMAQIANNPEEIALQGDLPHATKKAIIQALSSHGKLAELLLQQDKQSFNTVLMVLYRLLKNGDRF